jgi:hypothetical protein
MPATHRRLLLRVSLSHTVIHRYIRGAHVALLAITDFWGYFEPIRQQMPKNCSADVEAVVSHIDSVSPRYGLSMAGALI